MNLDLGVLQDPLWLVHKVSRDPLGSQERLDSLVSLEDLDQTARMVQWDVSETLETEDLQVQLVAEVHLVHLAEPVRSLLNYHVSTYQYVCMCMSAVTHSTAALQL